LKELARDIAQADLFRFPSVINAVAQFIPGDLLGEDFVTRHLEHLLWVEHRRALWQSGRIRSLQEVGCELRVQGREHLDATLGFPTVLLTPMTLAYEDALWVIKSFSGEREVVIYGEGLDGDGLFSRIDSVIPLTGLCLAGDGAGAPRAILRTLSRNGCFLTYPDFVYDGHKAQPVSFMGVKWPLSSAFINICARPGNLLLPLHIRRESDELVLQFSNAIELTNTEVEPVDPRWTSHLVGALVARLLEEMILSNPAQWLLLSTIVAECQQRAEI
jgi:lauroyl/myristoyl acyltransferase